LKLSSCRKARFGKSAVANGNISEGIKKQVYAVLTGHAVSFSFWSSGIKQIFF